jgi:hypothetical protein
LASEVVMRAEVAVIEAVAGMPAEERAGDTAVVDTAVDTTVAVDIAADIITAADIGTVGGVTIAVDMGTDGAVAGATDIPDGVFQPTITPVIITPISITILTTMRRTSLHIRLQAAGDTQVINAGPAVSFE